MAVVYKATWEDQKIVRGTLLDIADKVREAGIRKTASRWWAISWETNTSCRSFMIRPLRTSSERE